MDEIKDIDAIVDRESEEALRRFRAGDFTARLNARLASPPPRRPFVLFRKPALIPALGLAALAAAALFVLFPPGGRNGRLEAGFRVMTEALSRSEILMAIEAPTGFEMRSEPAGGRNIHGLAERLLRILSQREAASVEGQAPLRPLFSPKERFKILYEDRVILRVLTDIANLKET